MASVIVPHLISCDESGFSGNDMLGSGQSHFSYASHDLSLDEAQVLLTEARAKFPVRMPELKASKLLKSKQGRALLLHVLGAMKGRYIATLYEKKLALACKWFEYIYEPILQENNSIFYENNLHRFVAMFIFMQMQRSGAHIDKLALEFETFMRTFDPSTAPTLFGSGEDREPLMEQILCFARGYNVGIVSEARSLHESGAGKWVLDLSITALFSHLATWGERHPQIEVICDDSKPLRALSSVTDGMINRTDEVYVTMGKRRVRLTWNMAGPVAFASSASHAGIQLADLVAGVACALPTGPSNPDLAPLAECALPHLHPDCILPDYDVLDLEGEEAPVNWMVLESLATRADAGVDPLDGMAQVYAIARASLPAMRKHLGGRKA